jgi:hypothetical protein
MLHLVCGVRAVLHVVCYLLAVAFCTLLVGCYSLRDGCCMLHVACCMLHAICCLLLRSLHNACCMKSCASCMVSVARRLSSAERCTLSVALGRRMSTCCLLHTARCLCRAACRSLVHVVRCMAHVVCMLSVARCTLSVCVVLHVVHSCMLCVARCTLSVMGCMLSVAWRMSVACRLLPVAE